MQRAFASRADRSFAADSKGYGGTVGPGGGRTGAVLISQFITPGSVNDTPYNHYALLRSIEDLFALPHLGFAAQPGLQSFGADVYALWTATRRRSSRP